jgi:dihydrolipoamide dehydrogenase
VSGARGAGADRPGADLHTELLVVGAGPGGYTAAFRAADLGLEVALVERHERLGGVCLNVGCIPSKALLHVAKLITDAAGAGEHGIVFAQPEIELERLRAFKDGVVGRLTDGLATMARQRGVEVLRGSARLSGPHTVELDGRTVSFERAILATGSRPIELPGLPWEDPRLIDSTGALALTDVPDRLLVVGGGIIGLEMASVYQALGSRVTIVEREGQLVPDCDADLIRPLARSLARRCEAIHLSCTLAELAPTSAGLEASFSPLRGPSPVRGQAGEDPLAGTLSRGQAGRHAGGPEPGVFDRVLVAVGRRPNSDELELAAAGVDRDLDGFVPVDAQMRTNVPHIYAIGDLVGPPMLAHKATHEAKVAAETIAGMDVIFDVRGIPTVAYTDPELAWVGLTETQAKERGIAYERAAFPWSASGRALTLDSASGFTKLLIDPDTEQVLGAGIVGTNAGELIAEVDLALELGADALDLALTVHPHPTLSESVGLAAEVAVGTITDLPAARR